MDSEMDIVERLRAIHDHRNTPAEFLCYEAADEIKRLRDENGSLIAVCREFIERWPTERGIDNTIQRARAILLDHDLRNPERQSVNRAASSLTATIKEIIKRGEI